MVLVVGLGIIYHINSIFNEELKEVKGVQDAKHSRKVNFPDA